MKFALLHGFIPVIVDDETYNVWVSEALFKGVGPLKHKRHDYMVEMSRRSDRAMRQTRPARYVRREVDYSDIEMGVYAIEAVAIAATLLL